MKNRKLINWILRIRINDKDYLKINLLTLIYNAMIKSHYIELLNFGENDKHIVCEFYNDTDCEFFNGGD